VCTANSGQPEPGWKVLLRRVFLTFFFVLWVSGILLFYTMVSAHNAGESRRTATYTVPLPQHGNTKYVTPAEQHRIGLLLRTLVIGLPGELLFGVILYFGFRVNVWESAGDRKDSRSEGFARFGLMPAVRSHRGTGVSPVNDWAV